MLGLEILELLHQLVEFGVADLRLIENVVEILVVTDLLAESFDLFLDVFGGYHVCRIIGGRGEGKIDTRIEPSCARQEPSISLGQAFRGRYPHTSRDGVRSKGLAAASP
jgi:hypothetical protein